MFCSHVKNYDKLFVNHMYGKPTTISPLPIVLNIIIILKRYKENYFGLE